MIEWNGIVLSRILARNQERSATWYKVDAARPEQKQHGSVESKMLAGSICRSGVLYQHMSFNAMDYFRRLRSHAFTQLLIKFGSLSMHTNFQLISLKFSTHFTNQ